MPLMTRRDVKSSRGWSVFRLWPIFWVSSNYEIQEFSCLIIPMELQHSHSCSRLNSVWMRSEQGLYFLKEIELWKWMKFRWSWKWKDSGVWSGFFLFCFVWLGCFGAFFWVGYVYFLSCARCIGGSREDKCTAWPPALWKDKTKLVLARWQNRPDDLLSTLIHEKLLHLLTSDAFIVNKGLFCTANAGKGKPIAIPNEFHCCNSKIAHFETL